MITICRLPNHLSFRRAWIPIDITIQQLMKSPSSQNNWGKRHNLFAPTTILVARRIAVIEDL